MIRVPSLGGALLVLSLAAAGCEKNSTYTYFNIDVTLDQRTISNDLLDTISACAALAATPMRTDTADLRCMRHKIQPHLGTFQYTTSLTSGAITFSVIMTSFDGTQVAQGQTAPIGIVPGGTTSGSIMVEAIPGAFGADGGAPDGAASDGATSDGAGSDGATSDGAQTDGALDGAADAGPGDAADGAAPDAPPPDASAIDGD